MKNAFLQPMFLFILFSVLFIGCASTKPPMLLEPISGNGVYSFYSNGIPFAIVNQDSARYLISLEKIELLGKPYLRLWVLANNQSSEPVSIYPKDSFELVAQKIDKETPSIIEPESPTVTLNKIENKELASVITQSIGGALESISLQPTTISDNKGGVYKANDLNEKRRAQNNITQSQIAQTTNWYNIYMQSIGQGMLRKNTIFPNQSVNGYVYFPIKSLVENSFSPDQFSTTVLPYNLYKFYIRLKTIGGQRKIAFTQVKGW